jgi:hypothetical protein
MSKRLLAVAIFIYWGCSVLYSQADKNEVVFRVKKPEDKAIELRLMGADSCYFDQLYSIHLRWPLVKTNMYVQCDSISATRMQYKIIKDKSGLPEWIHFWKTDKDPVGDAHIIIWSHPKRTGQKPGPLTQAYIKPLYFTRKQSNLSKKNPVGF